MRNFTELTDEEQLNYMVDQYLDKKTVCIKGIPQDLTAEIQIIQSSHTVRLSFEDNAPLGLIKQNELTVYTIAKRYIEIDLKKLGFEKNKGEFKFIKARIANDFRKEARILLKNTENFVAENFKLSKYNINTKMKNAPICVQLAFDKLKPEIIQSVPNSTLETYDEEKSTKKYINAVNKTHKILYIENVYDESSYSPTDTSFLDYKDFLGTKLDQEIEALKQEKIKSLLIHPVVYENLKGERVCVGHFKIISNSEPVSINIITKLNEYSKILTDNIRDANLQIIKAPQKILNISKSGISIQVKDKEVINIFNSNNNEIVFDIRPKPTFRFSIFAKIVQMYHGNNSNYIIGMQFIGGEQRRGLSAWNKYIDKLYKTGKIDYL
ncbi:MAG: DUF1577 domain-containing protein [Spirochaetota bacterium]|nr:DUF1577 domain-containing protein [Spirochaetota bacterium]